MAEAKAAAQGLSMPYSSNRQMTTLQPSPGGGGGASVPCSCNKQACQHVTRERLCKQQTCLGKSSMAEVKTAAQAPLSAAGAEQATLSIAGAGRASGQLGPSERF